MQGRLGCWGLVPNLYFVSLEKWRGKNANNVPLSPPLRLFEVKIRFTSDSWKPIRGICLKGGEKLGVGWRILSAALIDVTPKKPQESEKRGRPSARARGCPSCNCLHFTR